MGTGDKKLCNDAVVVCLYNYSNLNVFSDIWHGAATKAFDHEPIARTGTKCILIAASLARHMTELPFYSRPRERPSRGA